MKTVTLEFDNCAACPFFDDEFVEGYNDMADDGYMMTCDVSYDHDETMKSPDLNAYFKDDAECSNIHPDCPLGDS